MGRVDERLIACEAREAELRKALVWIKKESELYPETYATWRCVHIHDKAKQALSNGKAAMQKQLDEVEMILELIDFANMVVEDGDFYTEKKAYKAKRDSLAEAIKEMG